MNVTRKSHLDTDSFPETHQVHASITGPVVLIGLGSIGKGVLPLLESWKLKKWTTDAVWKSNALILVLSSCIIQTGPRWIHLPPILHITKTQKIHGAFEMVW